MKATHVGCNLLLSLNNIKILKITLPNPSHFILFQCQHLFPYFILLQLSTFLQFTLLTSFQNNLFPFKPCLFLFVNFIFHFSCLFFISYERISWPGCIKFSTSVSRYIFSFSLLNCISFLALVRSGGIRLLPNIYIYIPILFHRLPFSFTTSVSPW